MFFFATNVIIFAIVIKMQVRYKVIKNSCKAAKTLFFLFLKCRPRGVVVRGAGCYIEVSRVRIPGKAWMSNFPSQAPPVAEQFCAKNWQMGGARFNHRSRLSTQPLGFCAVFSETRVRARIPQKDPPRRPLHPQAQVPRKTICLKNLQPANLFFRKKVPCTYNTEMHIWDTIIIVHDIIFLHEGYDFFSFLCNFKTLLEQ